MFEMNIALVEPDRQPQGSCNRQYDACSSMTFEGLYLVW